MQMHCRGNNEKQSPYAFDEEVLISHGSFSSLAFERKQSFTDLGDNSCFTKCYECLLGADCWNYVCASSKHDFEGMIYSAGEMNKARKSHVGQFGSTAKMEYLNIKVYWQANAPMFSLHHNWKW